jgi:transposase
VEKTGRQWWKYSPEFKRKAVDRMLAGEGVSALARELGIRRKFLYQWRDDGWGTAAQGKAAKPESVGVTRAEREKEALGKKIAALERLVGQQAAELDFFAAALRNIGAAEPKSGVRSDGGSTKRFKP